MAFVPAKIGEVRGPWRSSPGNPKPWQAAAYGPNGWLYTHGMTQEEVMAGARKDAESILAQERR